MTELIEQFSSELAARTAALQGAVAAIRLPRERYVSAILWRPDVVVASEQSIPEREEYDIDMPLIGGPHQCCFLLITIGSIRIGFGFNQKCNRVEFPGA